MPGLKAFGIKWKIGSDDFVFPYIGSVLVRIFWMVVISFALGLYESRSSCDVEHLLRAYLLVLIGVHCLMIGLELVIAFVSSRGTMSNSSPRKTLPYLLYVEMTLFAFEAAWDMVGIFWAFDPTLSCEANNSLLALSRFLLIWNCIFAFLIAGYMMVQIVCGKCCKPPKKMKYEQVKPSTSFSGRRLSRLSSGSLARHAQRRMWQWRLQLIFCCMKLQKYQNSIFTEVSVALADACSNLRGYVPTDVAAGLAIVSLEHNSGSSMEIDAWNELNQAETRKQVSFGSAATNNHIKKVVHFFRYALAAYGWKTYCSAGCCKACYVFGKRCKYCCKSIDEEEFQGEGDNRCGWNMVSLKKLANLSNSDFVFASFKPEVYLPAFFVAFDHKAKSVVIAIRGSSSFSDLLTGLGGEPGIITSHGAANMEHIQMFAHKGLSLAARAILLKLGTEAILSKAFALFPSYKLVITGHSSGAGVAVILSVLMKNAYPKMYCYAYSPPGGLLNADAVGFSKSFITSVVLGNDVIPRISLQNIEAVSHKIVHRIRATEKAKWRIFFDFFLNYTGLRKVQYTVSAKSVDMTSTDFLLDKSEDSFDSFGDGDEEELYDSVEHSTTRGYDTVTKKKAVTQVVRENLYLPGKILHIQYKKNMNWCSCKRELYAHWAPPSDFSEILMQKNMINHHSPGALQKAFHQLMKQEQVA